MTASLINDLQIARSAARAGAAEIRKRYGQPQEVRVKINSNTLVTETDLAAEDAIIQVLQNKSSHRIMSEESGFSGTGDGPVWVVDPLDGTSNFSRSLPLFAVSVALVFGKDILAGVIIDPIHDMEYYAYKGSGAFCNNQPLIPAKPEHSISFLFLNHGSSPADKKKYTELNNLLGMRFSLRKLGTTALELCYVAAGLFDGFICSGDELWDYAAGALIATEAGCLFSDWQGRDWDGITSSILVCRPELHPFLVDEISHL